MTQIYNMHAAKSNLSKIVELVIAGEKVTIARDGIPLVDLVVHQAKPERLIGFAKGQIWVSPGYDIDAVDPEIVWNLENEPS